jgi:hypothetical protein
MVLQMPYFAERNFAFTPNQRVAVWAESDAPLSGDVAGLWNEHVPEDRTDGGVPNSPEYLYAVRGTVAPEALASARIHVPSPKPGTALYSARLREVAAYSALSKARPLTHRLVSVVLDTSLQCAEVFKPARGGFDWSAVLKDVPDDVRVALFAGTLSIPPMEAGEARREWPALLSGLEFRGADEQTDNLEKAWDLCAGERNAAVLWLHGKLPVELSDISGLEQRFKRRGDGGNGSPVIMSMQLLPGPNRIEEKLGGISRLPSFYGQPAEERLARVFSMLVYPEMNDKELTFSTSTSFAAGGLQSSPHIARLAFAEEIERELRDSPNGTVSDESVETALRLRVVTPVTGAVVLENDTQYAEHDLDPAADIESVPTIPEPGEVAVAAVVCTLLLALYLRRRCASPGGRTA